MEKSQDDTTCGAVMDVSPPTGFKREKQCAALGLSRGYFKGIVKSQREWKIFQDPSLFQLKPVV